MPKTEIDYSNTIIYKITCKDPNVADVYVGHTTNFVQRKHAHKQNCVNDKTPNYKCKLYEVIRNNGGWVNWKMEIINFFECHDHYEARKKEQEYFISLNATLNSIEPMPKPKPKEITIKPEVIKETFFCEKCNTHCSNLNLLEKHNQTKKHNKININKVMISFTDFTEKYICQSCNIKCTRESEWNRHVVTRKHIRKSGRNDESKQDFAPNIFTCKKCHKEYKSYKGLWSHKKICNIEILTENIVIQNEPPQATDSSNNNIIQLFIKENTDFKTMMMDMMKNTTDLQKQMLEMCKNINCK